MKFLPSPGFVLIEPIEKDTSKLSLSNEDGRRTLTGSVIAVGNKFTSEFGAVIECPVKVGDNIAHATIGYEEIVIERRKLRVVPFTKIIGIYENTD